MPNSKLHIVSFILLLSTMLSAQNLDKHLWQNRILLVIEQEAENPLFDKQLETFDGLKVELQDRKMLIYQIKGKQYKLGVDSKEKWQNINDPDLLNIIAETEDNFEVVLIGLDGGVKQRQSNIMTSEDLFSIIDRMPMRRQELRNRNK